MITYFLLCGYTPFDRDSSIEEMQAIMNGDFSFEPDEYWHDVSDVARDFVVRCLTVDSEKRMTANEASKHAFLQQEPRKNAADLLPTIRENFNARRTLHAAVDAVKAINKLQAGAMDGALSVSPEVQRSPKSHSTSSIGLWQPRK